MFTFSFIFLGWIHKHWNPPWCRCEQPSAGHDSPERRHKSGCPDSWRGGAASWERSSRPEPPMTTVEDKMLTAKIQWCPPSARGGLDGGGAIKCQWFITKVLLKSRTNFNSIYMYIYLCMHTVQGPTMHQGLLLPSSPRLAWPLARH